MNIVLNKATFKASLKVAGAVTSTLFLIGSQEATLDHIKKWKRGIHKSMEDGTFYTPTLTPDRAKFDKELEEGVLNAAKKLTKNVASELYGRVQLGAIRSVEVAVQQSQRDTINKQNGAIYRLIKKEEE